MDRPVVPTIAISGHRAFLDDKDPRRYDDSHPWHVAIRARMATLISNAIRFNRTRRFIVGGALNVDMWAEEIVLDHMTVRSDVELWIAAPYPNQERVWRSQEHKERYRQILAVATKVIYVSYDEPVDKRDAGKKLFARDEFMVDAAKEDYGGLIAVWDGRRYGGTYHTVDYAEKHGLKACIIDPNPLRPAPVAAEVNRNPF